MAHMAVFSQRFTFKGFFFLPESIILGTLIALSVFPDYVSLGGRF